MLIFNLPAPSCTTTDADDGGGSHSTWRSWNKQAKVSPNERTKDCLILIEVKRAFRMSVSKPILK